jgi:hypothetical protein
MVANTSIMAHRDAELEGGGDHLIGFSNRQESTRLVALADNYINSRQSGKNDSDLPFTKITVYSDVMPASFPLLCVLKTRVLRA